MYCGCGMATIWNDVNCKLYFSNNENLIQYYFGKPSNLASNIVQLSQIRYLAQRFAQLMPHGVHNTPLWSPSPPVFTVSRISAVNGNLDIGVRVSVFLLEQDFYIGLFLDSKYSSEKSTIAHTHLYEYFKNLLQHQPELKLIQRAEVPNHLLIKINFNSDNYQVEAEFSDQFPLVGSHFENCLKAINNQEYDTVFAAERLALFLSFRQLTLPAHTPISPRVFDLCTIPVYQRPEALKIVSELLSQTIIEVNKQPISNKPIAQVNANELQNDSTVIEETFKANCTTTADVEAQFNTTTGPLLETVKPPDNDLFCPHDLLRFNPSPNPNPRFQQLSLNTLLYGPTASGKTYATRVLAMQALNVPEALEPYQQIVSGQLPSSQVVNNLKAPFDQAQQQGQVVFISFHANYAYEDFMEGLQASNHAGQMHYRIKNGIFKQLAKKAFIYKIAHDLGFLSNNQAFKKLAQEYASNQNNYLELEAEVVPFPKGFIAEEWQAFFKAKNMLPNLSNSPISCPNFVLIIDELNRAVVAKVFGELITLMDSSKRYGNSDFLTLALPNSQEQFCVPNNLFIVATLNMSEPALPGLSTAVKSRFDSIALKPQAEFLKAIHIPSLRLDKWLVQINQNIEVVLGAQFTIGHAIFASLTSLEKVHIQDLASIVRLKILPILETLFFDDWESIRQVLGESELANQHPTAWVHKTPIGLKKSNLPPNNGFIYHWNYPALSLVKSYQKIYEA